MKKRDIALILLGIGILFFLWLAPEETTHRVPFDETHQKFFDITRNEGKRAAEKFCEDCHNADGVPFPKDHPAKNRCLLCHKLAEH